MRLRLFHLALTASLLTGCSSTQLKVAPVDPQTGLIKSEDIVIEATVVTSSKFPVAQHKGLVFMLQGGVYGAEQMRELGYFDQVANYVDLQKIVIANGLQEQVPSVGNAIGLSKLYRAYKPFLWVLFRHAERGSKTYLQLVVINPDTLDEVFVSEVRTDSNWAGMTDQNTRYPLFNAFSSWIRQNR